ncbi:MAG: cysteine desulfurase, partial [Flavobacterium sp.]
MSTNTNDNGLPNIDDLQLLANELFKTLPNEFPKEISLSPDRNEHPRAAKVAETFLQTGNLGSSDTPISSQNAVNTPSSLPAFSGLGASPTVSNYGSGASALYPNAGAGFDPKSGVTTSGIQEDYNLNLNNPHTGFYDTNLKNAATPQLNEESFFSQLLLNNEYLPFQTENSSFETELKAALAFVDTQFTKREAFPLNGNEAANSYYFLDQNPFAFDKRNTNAIVGNTFDSKEISGFTT